MSARQRVAVVTGGAGGIGASIAEALGREGWHVVTVDPLVTLDGTEQLPEPADSTAARITAAGGSARASSASVTDGEAVRSLFDELVAEHGGLDAVVNVAGITRQSYFARGTEEDWVALLEVHLGGYLNVLEAALPLMAEAGHGRILGITSGSGWRAADAGGYSAAKRAVAALTWQLGRVAPPGVTVNALSPIANTRMVAAALERARAAGRAGGGGGLTLDAIPGPENLGPLGAYLVGDECGWCSGQVFFAGGPEVAVVDQPRLVEVVRTDDVVSLAGVLEAVVPRAFGAAEANQATDGGANPRFGSMFDQPAPAPAALLAGDVRSCAVVSERPALTAALTAALEARSITCHHTEPARDFDGAAKALRATVDAAGPIDAVVVALDGPPAGAAGPGAPTGWQGIVADHRELVEHLHADASWTRAVAEYAAGTERPVRIVTLTDATGPAGRSRAQASAQLARAAAGGTGRRVTALAVSMESSGPAAPATTGGLVGHLLGHPEAGALAGAELVVGAGWIGLRAHPRPIGTVVYGGPAIPGWMDGVLRQIVDAPGPKPPPEAR
jgi:NAD(P)-dependent dehydrogenase (short-subunit alcohol dehydrogenase family)